MPRTPAQIAGELHTLLGNAGIAGPYILVGHSLAGKNVRMFALQHPHEAAGMVLVDALPHTDACELAPRSALLPRPGLLVANDLFPVVSNCRVTAEIGFRPLRREGHERTFIWGLVGYTIIFGGMVSEMMGSGLGLASSIPGGLWEMFIGVWLIVKGFNASAFGSQPTKASNSTESLVPSTSPSSCKERLNILTSCASQLITSCGVPKKGVHPCASYGTPLRFRQCCSPQSPFRRSGCSS